LPRFRACVDHPVLWSGLVVVTALGITVGLAGEPPVEILEIPPEEIVRWDEHSFNGSTVYDLVEVDGRKAVHAICEDGTASGLFYRGGIDLTETPILEWSWRVDDTLEDVDETHRQGDDFAARIYLVEDRRLLPWRARALNYVWANEKPRGSEWVNPHTSRVRMVAVRSGPPEEPGTWRTERRNVRLDFRELHDRNVSHLQAVAIMTDCDDTGERLEGWYGSLRFLSSFEVSR